MGDADLVALGVRAVGAVVEHVTSGDVVDSFESTIGTEVGKRVATGIFERLRRRGRRQPELNTALIELDGGSDESRQRLLREVIRALEEDPSLRKEVKALLGQRTVDATGSRSVAIGGDNLGNITTGR